MSQVLASSSSGNPTKSFLLTLFDFAFRSRLLLPLLVSAGFMLFDLRIRLEVEFQAHVRRQPEDEDREEEEEEDNHELQEEEEQF